MKNNYTVYIHKSPSGKVYIGITKQNIKRRWRYGLGYKENKYFFRAIQKYGWDNFEHIVLYEGVDKCRAELLEMELIKKYRSSNAVYGYNTELGGKTVGTVSEKTKEKLRKANLGKKFSRERCEQLSIAQRERYKVESKEDKELRAERMRGEKNPMYGKKHSEEVRLLISQNRGDYWTGKKHKGITKQRISNSHKKKVCRISDCGSILSVYSSMMEASKDNDVSVSMISEVCGGKRVSAKGILYKFLDNTI